MNCLQCGQCCRVYLIDATIADAEREPRIKTIGGEMYDDTEKTWLAGYCLNSPENNFACVFLVGNKCGIHETKPECCRGFEPGNKKCLQARL